MSSMADGYVKKENGSDAEEAENTTKQVFFGKREVSSSASSGVLFCSWHQL
jgi:hypothetical protein